MPAVLCIQCTAPTGEVGDFLKCVETGEMMSPVYSSLVDFYAWADVNGWTELPRDRKYPTGLFQKGAQ